MTPAVTFAGLGKRYGKLIALDEVSFDIAPGEFFGLLGPNGAGKTTLITILAGLTRATSGSVSIMGHDVRREPLQARRLIGVVPQELVFDPFFTVRETLEFQSGYFGIRDNAAWIGELLERLALSDKADTNMRKLSGGMKRRVLVAQALVHKPPVIVLDEPTAGVDVELRQLLWQFIAELNRQGHAVLLTTHYLEEAEQLCQRIAMLKNGRVLKLQGTRELLRSSSGVVLSLRLKHGTPPPELLARAASHEPRLELHLANADEVAPALSALHAAGCELEELEVSRPTLEDVFLATMSEAQT